MPVSVGALQDPFGPDGDISREMVRVGNATMEVAMNLAMIAEFFGVDVALEQPCSSRLWEHPTAIKARDWISNHRVTGLQCSSITSAILCQVKMIVLLVLQLLY